MNRKTFALALAFFGATLVWLGVCLYWRLTQPAWIGWFDLFIAVLFAAAAGVMVVHEFRKKKRVHLVEADRHQIP